MDRVRIVNKKDRSPGYNVGWCSRALWEKIQKAQENNEIIQFTLESEMLMIPFITCTTSRHDHWVLDYTSQFNKLD